MSRARRHRARNASIAAAAVLAVLVAVLATRSTAPGSAAYTSLGGKPAPPVSGKALVGGGQVSLAGLRGRWVVVDFFASWCAPCQEEAPQLESFLFAHRHDNVSVLGVDISDTAADGRAFLERVGATWPAVEDNGQISAHWGVADPPQSFLVAPDGKVVGLVKGGVTATALDGLISEAEAARQ